MPEFLDAGFLPRGRSTAGSLPAQTSPPGPATPTGSPPAQTVSPSPSSRPSQTTPPSQTPQSRRLGRYRLETGRARVSQPATSLM